MDDLSAYLQELGLRDLHPRTVDKYAQELRSYHEFLGGEEPSLEAAKRFVGNLRSGGYSRRSIEVYYVALRGFHQWRGETLKMRLQKSRVLPPYIPRASVERLISQGYQGLRSHTAEMCRRNGAMIEIMAFAGLRRGEVLRLRVGDLDFDRKTILIVQSKGYQDGVIPMAERLVVPLRALCEGRNARDRVFGGLTERKIHHIVKRLGRRIGWDDVHPHLMRHFFCTALLEAGANVKEVQELARHRTLEATSIYLSVTQAHLRQAIAKLDSPVPTQTEAGLTAHPSG